MNEPIMMIGLGLVGIAFISANFVDLQKYVYGLVWMIIIGALMFVFGTLLNNKGDFK